MSGFSIRLARPEDADAFPAIERAAGTLFETIEGLESVAGMQAIPAEAQRKLIRKGHSLVAEADGRIVGFLSTEPFRRELHVREFSVRPDHQGKGIGAVLLRAVAIDARNSGFAALTLTTFSDVPWNAPFYARHGFVELHDLEGRPHLADSLEKAVELGLPRERRCAFRLSRRN